MREVFSVGQINTYIKNLFMQDGFLHSVSVRGEVSNCRYHSSGHIYFTLKDHMSALSCVMFQSRRKGLSFPMRDGDQVVVSGSVEVYDRDGKYQLYASTIAPDGAGALAERFERLKKELEERGMFSPEYKKPLPKYVRRLGIVTAPTGAAVRDMINVSLRRNPYLEIILYPALVQGADAPESIVRGIRVLDALGPDVIIIGRGGGSMEDLQAFNEESVAQAVFDARTPVISAVGHETDFVITDFVADLRAPTPSAAAELAVCEFDRILGELAADAQALTLIMNEKILRCREKSALMKTRLSLFHPQARLRERRMHAARLEEALGYRMVTALQEAKNRLKVDAGVLEGLSPLKRLSGGYAYVEKEDGRALTGVRQAAPGDGIRLTFSDGRLKALVETVEERTDAE